ncbi:MULTISPECIES: TetR/AcrR family transcriptional regulator [unclassified Streptomyces]|uniref:TetR/AcrR family transcriptional regulator n=1 Tax=unclassified Streptomyces TaxID=2593676 RepID=UPI0022B70C0C|nr:MULTISPECIES: TetR/AcrR family transcriptional regulator [unclassified Streptomyces]MCZ7412988.1 TetR/AcrR family transcriptional regulator [Streptomyces sp. WMMC897]MCZ7434703.1 TetR/AcrR family transcriptional regulator [Streptomyces sp. WMMC1477]
MARVSQEHLAARRRQILDGARRCFTRNGFHATSMQDVLQETGLSAGAVYRYFRSKDDLITAIAMEVFDDVGSAFADAARAEDPALPDVLLPAVLCRVLGRRSDTTPALALQVWAETLRNEELAARMREGYARVLHSWIKIVHTYQERGLMPKDATAEDVARALIGAAQGFLVQQALFGPLDPHVLRTGLRGLMAMDVPEPTH